MSEFKFLQNPLSKQWVIAAHRRAQRPDIASGTEPVCPFCPGKEEEEKEVYRIEGKKETQGPNVSKETRGPNGANAFDPSVSSVSFDSSWSVRVIPNKFPFAPIHEVIVHSPDHDKNFESLPSKQVELILQTYRQRYNEHAHKGQVYIFHNRGEHAGESLPHPHSQLAVVPFEVKMEIPTLTSVIPNSFRDLPPEKILNQVQVVTQESSDSRDDKLLTKYFILTCPKTSQWPDEVWIAPIKRGRAFGEITDPEVTDLAVVLEKLIHIMAVRHKPEFPFNFYIYPGGDWYMRFIPRTKTIGGFEVGTGIFVNTQDPQETMTFIQEHFVS